MMLLMFGSSLFHNGLAWDVFLTISLAVTRIVLDVNRVGIVDTLDARFIPPDRHLRISVHLILSSVLATSILLEHDCDA